MIETSRPMVLSEPRPTRTLVLPTGMTMVLGCGRPPTDAPGSARESDADTLRAALAGPADERT